MTFIVKCVPVLKEWNFGCCSCSLRAAAVVQAWIVTTMLVSELVTCILYLSHSEIPYEYAKILIGFLGTLVGKLILDVLLLYGIHNKKPVYMLPFLVFDLISIVIAMAILFIAIIFAAAVSNWELHPISVIAIAVCVFFQSYLWVVLYSYYRQLEEEKNPNSGIVNCTYQIANDQVQMLPEDGKVPSNFPDKLAPGMA